MDEREHAESHMNEKIAQIEAARDLLVSTKRTLQLLDEQIAVLSGGRAAVEPADDVSTEHRVSWLGVVDDNDMHDGILYVSTPAMSVGFANPKNGTIRNQEDAAFVCTNVFVAQQLGQNAFAEGFENHSILCENLLVRLTDMNTGRNLVSGFTTGPTDLDRGAVPLSFLASSRYGLGPPVKNKFFSEFTIPRAGAVRVELFNVSATQGADTPRRLFFTLFGFKVYGA